MVASGEPFDLGLTNAEADERLSELRAAAPRTLIGLFAAKLGR